MKIKQLPPLLREKALQYARETFSSVIKKTGNEDFLPEEDLSEAFSWGLTDEGYGFWYKANSPSGEWLDQLEMKLTTAAALEELGPSNMALAKQMLAEEEE